MIRKYELLTVLAISAMTVIAYLCGRFINIVGYQSIIIAICLGVVGGLVTALMEYLMDKRKKYEKGDRLETDVASRLKNFDIEQNVETGYGDLDFFVETDFGNYGLEVKNYDGKVEYKNGVLLINNFDHSWMLSNLLRNCKIIRDSKFGDTSKEFIKPVLIFGYKTSVNISDNIINFNRADIIVTDVQHFIEYIR